MSIKVMTMVWEHGPEQQTDLLILLAISDWANDEGEAWPSMGRLARKARVDERTARRAVRRLEEEGYLSTVVGGIRNGEQRVPNRYAINLSKIRGGILPPGGADDIQGGRSQQIRGGTAPANTSVEPPIEPPVRVSARSRARTKIDRDWKPPDSTVSHVNKNYPDVAVWKARERFVLHHLSKGDTSENWPAAFVLWCAGDQQRIDERENEGTDDLGFPKKSAKAWRKHIS